MTTLDLEAWIDTVHASLDSRMSNRYPAAAEPVAIAYTHQKSTARATAIPRVEWGAVPKYSATMELNRPLKGGAAGIGVCTTSLQVDCLAATLDDCRALAVNLVQAMLAVTDAPKLTWPIKARQAAKENSCDGRLAQKIELWVGIDFTIPLDPQDIDTWVPTGPTIEGDVDQFDTTVVGETFSQT